MAGLREVGSLSRLPGMRTFLPEASKSALAASDRALSFLAEAGFQRVDTPILEDSDLFARKGGGEMTGLLYTFSEPDGRRLSLRPEFTTSIIRMYVESDGLALPLRWSYAGPVFRFDRAGGGRCRQFIQVGAEIIGDYSSRSDAEVIGSAIEGLQRLGLPSTSVRLGHVETLSRLFAAFELSDSARRFVTGNLGGLKRGRTTAGRLLERAREAGLVDEETPSIDGWGAKRAREALQLLILEEGARGPMGRRTAEEIMARLERKSGQSRDPVEMGRALDLASRLVGLEGPASQTIADARAVASRSGTRTDALDPLEELVEALAESGIGTDTLVIDMGMARGMAYYTGALFDLAAGQGAGTLGGGGRYDGLVQTLGGPEVPALGFAYDMEAVSLAAQPL